MGPLAILGCVAAVCGVLTPKRRTTRNRHASGGMQAHPPGHGPQPTGIACYVSEACDLLLHQEQAKMCARKYEEMRRAQTVPSMDSERRMHELSAVCDQLKRVCKAKASYLDDFREDILDEYGDAAYDMVMAQIAWLLPDQSNHDWPSHDLLTSLAVHTSKEMEAGDWDATPMALTRSAHGV